VIDHLKRTGQYDNMVAAWEQYREENNVILPDSLPEFIRPMWLIDGSAHPDPMP
jgi:hypothetical protein